ncbi:MAG: alpha/beta fold hydrolase [Alphaproteobacteria bacterium]|nr:alpha/beta fold hydrolase [Alphaproteobacteria bacterium]
MRSYELTIDVSGATGIAVSFVAATLFLPDDFGPAPLELLFCLHGGGYRRGYWHPVFAGEGYSFAAYMAARGYAVLTVDLLGMGDSFRPEPESLLSRNKIAAANNHVLSMVGEGLRRGNWGALPSDDIAVTGIGHSIGGMMIITQAAEHAGLDRVAVLGWTNQPLTLAGVNVATLSEISLPVGYHASPRNAMRALFYAADVPTWLIEADEAHGSKTPSCLGRDALAPGIVHTASAAISAPIFLGNGNVDTSPDHWAEAAYFKSSRDITMMVLEGAAHCHNFASSRRKLWERMDRWIVGLPADRLL